MTFSARGDATVPLDIDMDRLVADAEYRRRIIYRLRQERILAEAQKARHEGGLDYAGDED